MAFCSLSACSPQSPSSDRSFEHAAQPPLHPCTIEREAARCGDITVPENYGKPDGRRIALHAVVLGGFP
jgi:hypothetical protein